MHRIDADAHVGNLFSEGDPITGAPGTKIGADWLNAVQEEIVAVLTAAGISPVKANNAQLAAAADALIRGLKAGALLRVGTSDGNDLELVRAGLTMLALTAAGIDAKGQQFNNVASLRLVPGAAGGSVNVDGDVHYDNVTHNIRARMNGITQILATAASLAPADSSSLIEWHPNFSVTSARLQRVGNTVALRTIAQANATVAAPNNADIMTLPAEFRPSASAPIAMGHIYDATNRVLGFAWATSAGSILTQAGITSGRNYYVFMTFPTN